MKEDMRKELVKMRKALKKPEKERVIPLIEIIEGMIDDRFVLNVQSVCAMSDILKSIASETENAKVHRAIVNILILFVKNMESFKHSGALIPIKTQLCLDRTMVALDIFIANLIDKVGGQCYGYSKK